MEIQLTLNEEEIEEAIRTKLEMDGYIATHINIEVMPTKCIKAVCKSVQKSKIISCY